MSEPNAAHTAPPMKSCREDDGYTKTIRDQPIQKCRDYGRGMPIVSGATFALPASAAAHAFACTAGNTAFCASAPAIGANCAPRLVAYCFSTAELTICSAQIFSIVAITSGGTPF